jgi:predicted phosphohydrolase
MDLQYASDLHTEISGSAPVRLAPLAPVLLLAGDVGSPSHPAYAETLNAVAQAFQRVFVVAGNHEYYHESIASGEARLATATAGRPNVTYLQNQAAHLPDSDISIFGGTFWTSIPPEERDACREAIADYRRIQGFSPEESTRLHEAAVAALAAALEAAPGRRWVVVSHHMPKCALVAPQWVHHPATAAFACDVALADDPRIVAWVYGHTHTAGVSGKFYCNPRGYPGEWPARPMERVFRVY